MINTYCSRIYFSFITPTGTGAPGSGVVPPGGGAQPDNPAGGGNQGTSYIQVTAEEREAIERVRIHLSAPKTCVREQYISPRTLAKTHNFLFIYHFLGQMLMLIC